jgi:5-formyltetrahydrofolate cyclo-ligase
MAQSTAEVRDARRRLRALRLSLEPAERLAAERAIAVALRRLRLFRPGRRIAVYLAMRGEVDLSAVFMAATRSGAQLFAPRVTSRRRREMTFVPLAPGLPTRAGAFGIHEPVASAGGRWPALRLDAVLVPVVGFDADGNRLGMGAGFYDRAFRGRRRPGTAWRRPRLIGVAFACQQLPRIEPSPWDVPLDLIVTEDAIIQPARRAAGRPEAGKA